MKRTKKVVVNDPNDDMALIEPIQAEVVVIPQEKEVLKVIPQEEKPIRWKKIGRGSLLINNHYIKPNQVFTAKLSDVPKAFRDLVIPMEKPEEPVDALTVAKPNSEYTLEASTEANLWNIVDKRGKKINERPMAHNEAVALINVL